MASKTAAIHALGACTFFGGASDGEIVENMAYLLDIVSSDGEQISALDAPNLSRQLLKNTASSPLWLMISP